MTIKTRSAMPHEGLTDLLHRRRSIRSYKERSIEPERVEAILAAADAAPTAGNLQSFRIVCVSSQPGRKALAAASFDQDFVGRAAMVLVFLSDPGRSATRYGRRGSDLYALQDATIACAYAQLRAAELGIGSTWVGAFDEAEVSRAVRAPADLRPVALLTLGYPAEKGIVVPRRGPEELVVRERF